MRPNSPHWPGHAAAWAAWLRLTLVLAALPSLASLQGPPRPQPAIRIIFRLDDFAVDSDAALERSIIDSFASRGLCLTVGVIPFAAGGAGPLSDTSRIILTPDKIDLLKHAAAEGVVEVALHGCTHTPPGLASGDMPSEFVGMPLPEQRQRIALGRDSLEGALQTPVRTFLPPWNRYDDATARALEDLGFRVLSANRDSPVPPESRLMLLPFTCQLRQLKSAVAAARAHGYADSIIVTMLHYESFSESRRAEAFTNLEQLGQLLDWVKAQPDVSVVTFAGAARLPWDAGPAHQAALAGVASRNAFLPAPLRTVDLRINPPNSGLDEANRRAGLRLCAFYGALAALALAAGAAARRTAGQVLSQAVMSAVVAVAVLGGAGLIVAGRARGAPWIAATGWTATLGLLVGLLLRPTRTRAAGRAGPDGSRP